MLASHRIEQQSGQIIKSNMIKSLRLHLFLFACLFVYMASHNVALADNHDLTFSKVWIAEAPPVSQVLAAYMTINNHTNKDIKIFSATSSSFSSTTFHKTIFEDGLAKMRHLDSLIIPANSSLELKRGGFHMMLFNPVKPLHEGDKVTFNFKLDNQHTITVDASVKKAY